MNEDWLETTDECYSGTIEDWEAEWQEVDEISKTDIQGSFVYASRLIRELNNLTKKYEDENGDLFPNEQDWWSIALPVVHQFYPLLVDMGVMVG